MCDTDLGRRARELLLLVYPYVRRTAYNGWIMERLDAAIATGEGGQVPEPAQAAAVTSEAPSGASDDGDG
ncbi:MAG TPA: hypothetical protein VMR21_15665 [Vicinamibacteria bacterium]|nr:hypothetical protein [Vicinamibacteria bacterium]